jgi:hypothetical protein
MTREIDFGNNDHAVLARELPNGYQIFRAEVTPVRHPIIDFEHFVAYRRRTTLAGDLGQSRPAGDLDAPTLVVVEVEMNPVEAVVGGELNESAYRRDVKKVARHVEMYSAPGIVGVIIDADARERQGFIILEGFLTPPAVTRELAQGAESVEGATGATGPDVDVVIDVERELLTPEGLVEMEVNGGRTIGGEK